VKKFNSKFNAKWFIELCKFATKQELKENARYPKRISDSMIQITRNQKMSGKKGARNSKGNIQYYHNKTLHASACQVKKDFLNVNNLLVSIFPSLINNEIHDCVLNTKNINNLNRKQTQLARSIAFSYLVECITFNKP